MTIRNELCHTAVVHAIQIIVMRRIDNIESSQRDWDRIHSEAIRHYKLSSAESIAFRRELSHTLRNLADGIVIACSKLSS